MKYQTLAIVATALSGALAADESNEKVVGSFIFHRHGDRLTKPTKYLTPIGSQQVFDAGSYIRKRYFETSSKYHIDGINSTYQAEQIHAQAPNSDVLQKSQVGFLQGLYPPLDQINVDDNTLHGSSMANGTTEDTPLGGYQYVVHEGIDEETPNAIWIEGSSSCNTCEKASEAYFDSKEFKDLNSTTHDFYQGLYDLLEGGLEKYELNYGNAYNVFDYMLVNSVHNETFADKLKDNESKFNQVRYLQDQYSKSLNYNSSNSDTYIGGKSLAGAVLKQLNETKVAGTPLLTYYTGSYSTFYQLFGALKLYDLDENLFTGLVEYASTITFELVKKNDDYNVRFSLRNGTGSAELKSYPILGYKDELMPYDEFVKKLGDDSIKDLASWCKTCGSYDLDMCIPHDPKYLAAKAADFNVQSDGGLSLAGAGGIGAGVTIGVVALVGAAAYMLFARKKKNSDSGNILPVTKEVNHAPSVHSNHSGSTR